jgi:hypothetical protein
LFSHTKITGSRCTPAKFIASWISPWLLVPSPNCVSATTSSPRTHAPIAIPTAWSTWVPTGELSDTTL